jgi:hypothetical protein
MFVKSVYLSGRDYASPYIQTNLPYKPYGNTCDSGIFDADNDGVEDNIHRTHGELDRFYDNAVFNSAEDIYNTKHGELPGHVQKENDPEMEPIDTYTLVDINAPPKVQP